MIPLGNIIQVILCIVKDLWRRKLSNQSYLSAWVAGAQNIVIMGKMNTTFMDTFGKRVHLLRNDRKWTQNCLQKRLTNVNKCNKMLPIGNKHKHRYTEVKVEEKTGVKCDRCESNNATRQHQNTAYVDEESNYSCMNSRIAPTTRYLMPAEDESFADWQDRRTTNGGR